MVTNTTTNNYHHDHAYPSLAGYLDEEDVADYAERLSMEMLPCMGRYPRETDLLPAQHLLWDWRPELVQQILEEHLTPRRAKLTLMSSMFHAPLAATATAGNEPDEDAAFGQDDDSHGEDVDASTGSGSDSCEEGSASGDNDDDSNDDGSDENEDSDPPKEQGGGDANSKEQHEELVGRVMALYKGPEEWRSLVLPPQQKWDVVEMDTAPHVFSPSVSSSSAHASLMQTEPHFGTQYWQDPLPDSLFTVLWAEAQHQQLQQTTTTCDAGATGARLSLHLPPPNPYIPTDLAMKEMPVACASTEQHLRVLDVAGASYQLPEKIVVVPSSVRDEGREDGEHAKEAAEEEEQGVVLWYLQDASFGSPKAEVCVRLVSPACLRDGARGAALLDLLCHALREKLNEELYMASMADLHCTIETSDTSLNVRVAGYSDKAGLLMATVIRTLFHLQTAESTTAACCAKAVDSTLDLATFGRLRELLLRQYRNTNLKACQSATSGRLQALKPSKCSAEAKAAALSGTDCSSTGCSTVTERTEENAAGTGGLELPHLLAFVREFTAALFVEFLVQGNVTRDSAVDLVQTIFICISADNNGEGTAITGFSSTGVGHGDLRSTSALTAISAPNPARYSRCHCPAQPIVQIAPGQVAVLSQVPRNPQEANSCVEVYFQWSAWGVRDLARLDLLEQLLTEPFFDSLRTKQQVT